jgi:hypothetical protein
MFSKRISFFIAALLSCGAISGCAIASRENRLTLNSLDDAVQGSVVTSSTTGKVIAAPVAFPVGVTAMAIDMALVTPARATIPAAKDTSSWLWENPQGSELRQMMMFMPKVAATPVVFTTDWAFRSVFTSKF